MRRQLIGPIGRALLGFALLMLLAGCGALSTFDTLVPKDRGSRLVARDLAYGADPRQRLDIYAPADGGRDLPVLVFAYGGSWTSGSKEDYSFVGRAFAAKGFLTAVFDYRLVPEVRYPRFVEDAAAATAFVHGQASRYGGNRERLFLAGHSAGAYNVIMVALAPEFLQAQGLSPSVVKGVAGLSGPYDFLPLDGPETTEAFKGVANLEATQPPNRVSRTGPPVLLLHGEADDFVSPRNSRVLAQALRRVGRTVEEHYYPGIDHPGTLLAIARPLRGKAPVLEDVATFFRARR